MSWGLTLSILRLQEAWGLCADGYQVVNIFHLVWVFRSVKGFLGGLNGKESVCNAGDLGLIPESGRSLGEGNGYPLQYSCLENSMDRGARWAIVHGVATCQT